MVKIILIVVGIIGYIWFGYFFGNWCWKVRHNGNRPNWLNFILWPLCHFCGSYPSRPVVDENSYKEYVGAMSMVWVFKIFWNLIAYISILVCKIVFLVYSLITYPVKWMIEHREEKR
jgi:hypothetical protein